MEGCELLGEQFWMLLRQLVKHPVGFCLCQQRSQLFRAQVQVGGGVHLCGWYCLVQGKPALNVAVSITASPVLNDVGYAPLLAGGKGLQQARQDTAVGKA